MSCMSWKFGTKSGRQNTPKVTPSRQKRRQKGRKVTPCTRRVVPKEMPAQRGYPTVWDHFPLTFYQISFLDT